MHPDTHRRGGGGADDRADLLISEVRAVTERQQVLVLGPQQPDQRAELLSSLAFEHVLLGRRVRGRSLLGERLRGPPPLDVAHRVPCDLEQPAGETALPAKPPELLERRREHPTSHILAGGRVRHPQPRVPEHPIEVAVIQPEKLARIRPGPRDKFGVRIDRMDTRRGGFSDRVQLHDNPILAPSSRLVWPRDGGKARFDSLHTSPGKRNARERTHRAATDTKTPRASAVARPDDRFRGPTDPRVARARTATEGK